MKIIDVFQGEFVSLKKGSDYFSTTILGRGTLREMVKLSEVVERAIDENVDTDDMVSYINQKEFCENVQPPSSHTSIQPQTSSQVDMTGILSSPPIPSGITNPPVTEEEPVEKKSKGHTKEIINQLREMNANMRTLIQIQSK